MKIKELRQDRKLSQQDFAELLGTSQVMISRYETRKSTPKADMLVKMARVLSCTVDELLR